MNKTRLKEAEESFLLNYPGGFLDPTMLEIAKKHKIEKMCSAAQVSFAPDQFESPEKITEAMSKIAAQSSMVSVFEKVYFKDAIKAMSEDEKEVLSKGLYEFLHGDEESGFMLMVQVLSQYKLAKWPILTVFPAYYKPQTEVFMKPTTVKGVIEYFELEGLKYSSKPTYAFYRAYREQINLMKKEVDASIKVENASFCGFLMMSIAGSDFHQ